AAALLNASREVAGLLGITLIGAVLRSRQGAALRHGHGASASFLAGYHAGLAFTVALVAVGVIVSYVALRKLPRSAGEQQETTAEQVEEAAAAELAR
ncbi:MAG TPA: hypothetical protein VK599_06260, partial [Streptosporangiaceae bacterium]|nr:hypothetical protein [Streptosporangiaceae bacterium]